MNVSWNTDLLFKELKSGDEIIAILDCAVNPIRLIYRDNGSFTDAFGQPFDIDSFKIIGYTLYPKELRQWTQINKSVLCVTSN